MAATTYKEIDIKLDKIIEDSSKVQTDLAVIKSVQITMAELLARHDKILMGSNGKGGMLQLVNAHDEYIKEAKAARKEATKSWIAIGMLFIGQIVSLIFNAIK